MESWKFARQKVKELIEVVEEMRDKAEEANIELYREWEDTGDQDAKEDSAFFCGKYSAYYTMVKELTRLYEDMLHI